MVRANIDIPERQNRILNIVKGQHGLRNKQEALVFILEDYEKNLEPEVRPEYLKKLKRIDKQRGIPFKNIDDLRKQIEAG
ncbi:MAG: DUF2683 family protein [archaeon]